MSHFLTNTCRIDGDAFVSNLAWSKVDGIAAVAVSLVDDNDRETHQVTFMNNEGALLPQSSISHDYEATSLDWQPNGKVLAIGWGDGSSTFPLEGMHARPCLILFPPSPPSQNRHGFLLVGGRANTPHVDIFQ